MSSSSNVLAPLFFSRRLRFLCVLAASTLTLCVGGAAGASHSHSMTADQADAVNRSVRTFMQTVSQGVTQEGPLAWIKYFDASPAFFMAVNGQMAFPDANAAKDGTQKFAQTIRHIELKWGDDLRVDLLNNEFAVVAASWREIQVDTAGHSVTETGYFTGVAEFREGRWLLRNAHWSSAK